MIDLIIPYYNNPIGLYNTLNSIDDKYFNVVIVDDHSTNYPMFEINYTIYHLNENHGPGYARQYGINNTVNEWIMFIDTGDRFISHTAFEQIELAIHEHESADIISFPYLYKDEIPNELSNRMHGKIYKRSFIEKYGITFSPESSYMNEDIGFNRACRMCTDNIVYKHLPIIKWVKDENSLTQKDNNVSLYRDQCRALSLVSIHAINIAKQNNVSIKEEINQISLSLYYWFIRVVAERPEYIQTAWTGAKIFYDYFKNEINPNTLLLGNAKLKKCLAYRKKISFPINILRFAHDIQLYDEVPKQYKGGD